MTDAQRVAKVFRALRVAVQTLRRSNTSVRKQPLFAAGSKEPQPLEASRYLDILSAHSAREQRTPKELRYEPPHV